jgi:parallel beta-helix repeat protein
MRDRLFGVLVACSLFLTLRLDAQSCNTRTTTGAGSTVTLVTAVEAVGTTTNNLQAAENDGNANSYYQLQTFSGPASITNATSFVSGPIADNDHAPFGLTFINGSANSVTVTRVDIVADRDLFRAVLRRAPIPIEPPAAGTWSRVNARTMEWNGLIVVPAKSGQGFIVDAEVSNVVLDILNITVAGAINTSAGILTAQGFLTNVFVPHGSDKVATAVVAFVDGGNYPRTINNAVAGPPGNLIGGQASTITLRVNEYAGNEGIAGNLALTVTIPAQWSNVAILTALGQWNPAGAVIVQPTATTAGSVTIRTTLPIPKGGTAPDVRIQATPPVVYTKSTFVMRASLSGQDTAGGPTGPHPVVSVCDGGGTILPDPNVPAQPLNVEFLSPRLNLSGTAAPIESIDLRTDFNIANNSAPVQVFVDVFNFTTSLWETLSGTPVTPGTSNVSTTASFPGNTLENYVDTSSRMRMRYRTDLSNPLSLRIDYLAWTTPVYWVVDNSLGADTYSAGTKFAGTAKYPLASLAKAAAVVGPGEQVLVRVGSSQSGVPYDRNVNLTTAGTATCKTTFQGVASGGVLPLIRGVLSSDFGYAIGADDVKVDSFQIDNMYYAAAAATGVKRPVFSNNRITVRNTGYGLLLDTNLNASVAGNAFTAAGSQNLMSLYDFASDTTTIDQNRFIGASGGFGVYLDGTKSAIVSRNIVTANNEGIVISGTSGTTQLLNNTVDANTIYGIHGQSAGAVVSRNNIITRNPRGYSANTATFNSDYDDVFGNPGANYIGVAAGIHNQSADPLFVQTINGALATYYQLGAASPCIDSPFDTGFRPFLGAGVDKGAVESH